MPICFTWKECFLINILDYQVACPMCVKVIELGNEDIAAHSIPKLFAAETLCSSQQKEKA